MVVNQLHIVVVHKLQAVVLDVAMNVGQKNMRTKEREKNTNG